MKTAIILAAGAGKKIWPYAEIRSKCMIPISNTPVCAFTVQTLSEIGFEEIFIVCGPFSAEFRNFFRKNPKVKIIQDPNPVGSAFSLLKCKEFVRSDEMTVFFGDTLISREDIQNLMSAYEKSRTNCALVAPVGDDCGGCIGCSLKDGCIDTIIGHPREGCTHKMAAFALSRDFFDTLEANSGRFTNTQVGMMSPIEGYLEMSVADEIAGGLKFRAVEAKKLILDIDRPWDILTANYCVNTARCGALTENILARGASIDKSASLNGYVQLGEGSAIGKNVIIEGNVIAGRNTLIENGAILKGNNVIGDNCYIGNYCCLEEFSTVGNECVMNHCAEFSGVAFRRAYLYHYMELYGVLGENVDLGAATVCGTLRFDDNKTIHRVRTRRETPRWFGEATYLGDYCRTGVNAILMPGVKVGVYSIIGPGVLLNRDVANNTLLYQEQALKEKPWGYEKYGW